MVQQALDARVLGAMANHVGRLEFEVADLFAQQLGLTLLQADSALAVRTGQLHVRQHLGMALKKIGRVEQKLSDVVFGDGRYGLHRQFPLMIKPGAHLGDALVGVGWRVEA